jgi:hypothetical protein
MKRLACTALLCAAALAASPVYALDAAGAQQVVDKFLGGNQAVRHVVTDLNGDGRPDIVLLWHELGPTSAYPKLTLFLDQGRTYRTLTADLTGQAEGLAVRGQDIVVDTLMLGPNDPRCCPTRKAKLHFRWQGGKLVALK